MINHKKKLKIYDKIFSYDSIIFLKELVRFSSINLIGMQL